QLVESVSAASFQQYEIANFAGVRPSPGAATPESKGGGEHTAAVVLENLAAPGDGRTPADTFPTRACRHNINYWRGGSFYGLGPSATSYVRGVRTKNWANTILYCEQLDQGKRAIQSTEALAPLQRAGETAAFGLRMIAGWQFDQFLQTTGH